jgi:hypothetical protein
VKEKPKADVSETKGRKEPISQPSVPIRSIRNGSVKHSIREPGLDSSVWYSFSFGSWSHIQQWLEQLAKSNHFTYFIAPNRKPEMIILSTVCTKLLCTNAHLGRRVAAHHLKVYTRGSRNGIAILDSDKILICFF